jgi:hypothetical protein
MVVRMPITDSRIQKKRVKVNARTIARNHADKAGMNGRAMELADRSCKDAVETVAVEWKIAFCTDETGKRGGCWTGEKPAHIMCGLSKSGNYDWQLVWRREWGWVFSTGPTQWH